MMREMFGSHPYHRDPLGSLDSVAALSRSSVTKQYEKILKLENLVFSLVGDVDTDEWLEKLQGLTKKLQWKETEWPPVEKTKLSDSRECFSELDREQTHIVLAFPGLTLTDPRRRTLDVLQSILAGQGGRLFLELRDKNSLAYTVSPMRLEGVDMGYIGTYIGCSPEKKDKAIQMMREELDQLAQKRVPDEELLRSQRYILGKHDISLQKGSSIASDMLLNEVYGLPFDEYKSYGDQVMNIKAEDVRKLATELFSQPHVLSVVGKK
jgi:zinc protease